MNRTNVAATRDTFHFLVDAMNSFLAYVFTCIIFKNSFSRQEWISFTIASGLEIFIFLMHNRTENVYNMTLFYYMDRMLRKNTKSYVVATISTGIVVVTLSKDGINRNIFVSFLLIYYGMIILNVLFFRQVMDKIARRRFIPRTLYVGSRESFDKFRYYMQKTTILINEIGYVNDANDLKDAKQDTFGYVGKIGKLEEIIRQYNIDQIYILQTDKQRDAEILNCVKLCMEMGIVCRVVLDIYQQKNVFSYVSAMGTYPVLTYHTGSLNNYEFVIKRGVDIIGAIVGIVVTSPLMVLIAMAVKLDSPGPIFERFVCVGKNGRHFKIWRFRCVGKWMHILKLENLPELFNVLSGSMSFVGMSPMTLEEVGKISNVQWRQMVDKPGIICVQQMGKLKKS